MKFTDTMDGAEFRGRSAADVVRKMKDAAWMGAKGKGAYMRAVADRCAQLMITEARAAGEAAPFIDPRSADAFLASLVSAGFLRKE